MTQPIKILIIGNGFGGIYALKNLHKVFHNNENIEITLVGERNYFLFTPLLHEVATGGINPSDIIEPIRTILGCCLNKFYLGKAENINQKNRTVKVGDLFLPYDYLIVAPGAETNFYDTPGAKEYSYTLKSIDDAIKIKNRCITQIERAMHTGDLTERKKILKFVVVGGGATGVELAAELEEFTKESFYRFYPEEIIDEISVVLIQKDSVLVPQFGPAISKKSLAVLRAKGIDVMLDSSVMKVTPESILLTKEKEIFSENVIWVAGIKPALLKFDEDVERSTDGRLIVNENLQVKGHTEIFAVGDAAFFLEKNKQNVESPLPALAQVAEKQSFAVAENIKLLIDGKNPEKFIYKSSGSLLSLGQWMAIGRIFNFTFSGYFAWWVWRTVYLSKLISSRKKIRVAVDWTMNIFFPRDISQL